MKSDNALKTIGETSEILGIPQHILRFWESKFSQISPKKIKNRRYYSANDIILIKKIKSLLYDDGYTIKGAISFIRSHPENKVPTENPIFIKNSNNKVKLMLIKKELLELQKTISENII